MSLGRGRAWTENFEIFVLSKLLELPVCPFWPLLAWGKGSLRSWLKVRQLPHLHLKKDLFKAPQPPPPLWGMSALHASLTPHCWAGYSIPRDGFQSTTSLWLCCVLLLVPVESRPAKMETEMAESQLLT